MLRYVTPPSPDLAEVASALRQVSRSLAALADALSGNPAGSTPDERYRALIGEWGQRGLTRAEASALFRKHGFAPQAAGGWARTGWLRTGDDDRRYLTDRSLEGLAQR
jgi:hypothetical protein